MKKTILRRALSMALSALLAIGGAAAMARPAMAKEYTYTATFYAGNQGRFTTAMQVRVDNRKSGSNYYIERASDGSRITVSGLAKGDVVSANAAVDGAVALDAGSAYYVKGLRASGDDNAVAGRGAFTVDRDRDFVVAYGMSADLVRYVVKYETFDGTELAPAQAFYGSVGDKPVVAYTYVEGYTPMTYNMAKTLSADPNENVMTFHYKESEGETIRIYLDGETNVVHIDGGTYTVNVPGPTIVQRPGAGNTGTPGGSYGDGTGQGTGQQQPSPGADGTEFVLNTETNEFHVPGCGHLPTVNASNSSGRTAQELVTAGYNGCAFCLPEFNSSNTGAGQGGDAPANPNQGQNEAQTGTGSGPAQPSGGQGGTSGEPGQPQEPSGSQGGGTTPSAPGGTPGTGTGTDLTGTGAHGARPDGTTGQEDDPNIVDDGNGGTTYRPGGSLDVVLDGAYEPADYVDLDSAGSDVPLGESPDGTEPADGSGTMDGNDPAQDGMNENTDGSGTGELEPAKKPFPVVPVAIGGVAVAAAIAGGIFFAYKKQQGGKDDGDGE